MATFLLLLVLSCCSLQSWAVNFTIPTGDYSDILARGDASISGTSLELTTNKQDTGPSNSSGRVFYRDPMPFREASDGALANFSTAFTFQILYRSRCSGDGMAFLIAPDPQGPPPESNGRSLGLMNTSTYGMSSNHIFAIEFDTFANQALDQLPAPHVGVDINSLNSTFATKVNGNGTLNGTFQAAINYYGSSRQLLVRVTNESNLEVAAIHETIDLGDVLLEKMYVGFSAATGACSEIHRVFNWSFSTSAALSSVSPPISSVSPPPPPPTPPPPTKRTLIFAIIFSATGITVAGCLAWYLIYKFCRRLPRGNTSSSLTCYSYGELSNATGGFRRQRVLGSGGFGTVFRGEFTDMTVAIKVLKEGSLESEHQFLAELSTLSEFQHPNLVRLRGWCHGKGKMMLVYDYMPNNSLDKHLFSETGKFLDWKQRLKITAGVAKALHFLHEGREEQIIHRDVKVGNVLLDKDYNAKLGDFGLARLVSDQTVTRVGTLGYIAPELVYAGRASDKSDVYSFGILTLEIFTGKKMLLPVEQWATVLEWVWVMHDIGRLLEVVDPGLKAGAGYDAKTAEAVLHMAIWCSIPDDSIRLSMRECCKILEGNSTPQRPPTGLRPEYAVPSSRRSSSAPTSSSLSLSSSLAPASSSSSQAAARSSERLLNSVDSFELDGGR